MDMLPPGQMVDVEKLGGRQRRHRADHLPGLEANAHPTACTDIEGRDE